MATPVALLIALGRRRGDVAALLAIVIAQVAVYCAVYFATNLDSTAHIESSFHRIIAALAPLAVSGIALALTEIEGLSRPDHP
jgi:preprotein translocase subunit SecF